VPVVVVKELLTATKKALDDVGTKGLQEVSKAIGSGRDPDMKGVGRADEILKVGVDAKGVVPPDGLQPSLISRSRSRRWNVSGRIVGQSE
jgi:hypothetical protein